VPSTPPLRLTALALVGSFAMAGCYGLTEPSFDPGDPRDVLHSIVMRGIVATEPIPGETACDDHDLVGNSLYLTARMPEEEEPRDVYIHMYREKWWDRSEEEVDECQATYAAAHPDSEITRLDIPTYRIFGADWSEELTEELTKALDEASRAGSD
jgi:hypothetical protein